MYTIAWQDDHCHRFCQWRGGAYVKPVFSCVCADACLSWVSEPSAYGCDRNRKNEAWHNATAWTTLRSPG